MKGFIYLGIYICCDGRSLREIRVKIVLATKTFMDLSKVLTNRRISFFFYQIRKRIPDCYTEPIMIYGSEAWTINKAAYNIINASGLWLFHILNVH